MWTAITLVTCLVFEAVGRAVHGITKQKRAAYLSVYSPHPVASGLGGAAIVLALSWIEFLPFLPPRPVDFSTFLHSLIYSASVGVGVGLLSWVIGMIARLIRRRRSERGA